MKRLQKAGNRRTINSNSGPRQCNPKSVNQKSINLGEEMDLLVHPLKHSNYPILYNIGG